MEVYRHILIQTVLKFDASHRVGFNKTAPLDARTLLRVSAIRGKLNQFVNGNFH